MAHILLLSGSPSNTSRSAAVLELARRRFAAENIDARILSIRDFPAEDLILAKYDSPAFNEIKQLVEKASALVVSTPVYKASYSGGLKALLDILPQTALRGKIVLPIATGGSPAHQLAIDYALKPVLSALGASDIHQGVYIVDKQLTVGADGSLTFSEDLGERFSAAIAHLAVQVKARLPVSTQTQA
ncbi:MAG: NADPH-dependent FMN reductase [Nibricoccus sp.]